MSLNVVILAGNLCKDGELRYTDSQKAVYRNTIAVQRLGKDKGTDFISIVAFGNTAETLDKYTKKGTKLVIDGRLQTGSYEKDGKKFYTSDVIVNSITFCESKGSAETSEVVKENAETSEPVKESDIDSFLPDTGSDDLPF